MLLCTSSQHTACFIAENETRLLVRWDLTDHILTYTYPQPTTSTVYYSMCFHRSTYCDLRARCETVRPRGFDLIHPPSFLAVLWPSVQPALSSDKLAESPQPAGCCPNWNVVTAARQQCVYASHRILSISCRHSINWSADWSESARFDERSAIVTHERRAGTILYNVTPCVCLSVCLFDTVSCSDGVIVMSSRHDDYKYAQFRGEFPCCAVHCRSSCSVLQRGKAALIASVVHYSSPTSVLIYWWPANYLINPLECKGNDATSNNMKLVHWLLMGGLLHLYQM